MPPSPAATRPRQVTLAGWLVMAGSVLVVVMVFDKVAGLHSLETREQVQDFVAGPPGSDLGLGVSGVLDLLRVLCMVAAGCATAAAVLGYQVLQRSRTARLGLTILALPLFLTGLVAGGFTSTIVAVAALMLWSRPARDWFAGRTPAPATGPAPRPTPPTHAPPPPAPRHPAGEPGSRPAPYAPSPDAPGPWPPAAPAPRTADPEARPREVVLACTLTWLFAALALVLSVSSIVVLSADPGAVLDEVHRQNPDLMAQGLDDDLLRTATFVVGGVLIVWSLAAILVAVLAYRRVRGARVPLLVSTGGSALCLLLASLAQPLLFVPLAASVVALALLVRPEVRAWFDRR